jgi:hypothetical protein
MMAHWTLLAQLNLESSGGFVSSVRGKLDLSVRCEQPPNVRADISEREVSTESWLILDGPVNPEPYIDWSISTMLYT